MQVDYTADASDLDSVLTDASDAAPDTPIRIRVQPQVWVRGHDYVAWKKVSWPLKCESISEAIALRRAMEAFFLAVGQRGPRAVGKALSRWRFDEDE